MPQFEAPNVRDVVQRVMDAHPEINTQSEYGRGDILDYVILELGGAPWGRKARNKDGSNLNTDALVYLRSDGNYEIYDVIGGGSGKATWGRPSKILRPGENGWWVEVTGPPPPRAPQFPGFPDGGPTSNVLKALQKKLRDELTKSGNTQFKNSEKTDKTADEAFPEDVRIGVADRLTYVVQFILDNIVSKFPPTSRKGGGEDGGQGRHPGGEFEL